jgi:YVTN family beta-propeller protein
MPAGSQLGGVAVTPDGKKVYLANYNSDRVYVIDAATNKVTVTLTAGSGPSEVAIGKFLDK